MGVNRWRHAKLTWWESEASRNKKLPPKGMIYMQHITGIKIEHEEGSIWMDAHCSAAILSHEDEHKTQAYELTLILPNNEAETFRSLIEKYKAALDTYLKKQQPVGTVGSVRKSQSQDA